MQNPAWRDVLAGEAMEARPVEPVPLTSPQQGVPPSAADFAAEAVQSQQIRRNCMVREGAIQNQAKPLLLHRHGCVPPLQELFADRGQCCSHALLDGQANYLELPF